MGLGSWLGLCSHLPHPVPCLQGAGVPRAGGYLQCSELLHLILTASTSAASFCRGSEVSSGLPLAVGWSLSFCQQQPGAGAQPGLCSTQTLCFVSLCALCPWVLLMGLALLLALLLTLLGRDTFLSQPGRSVRCFAEIQKCLGCG